MLYENKLAIVIIAYNNPELIIWQQKCLSKFCLDDYNLIIIDNSSDENKSNSIKYHTKTGTYIRTNASSSGGSQSHAFAANFAMLQLKDQYKYFLFLDHDCFLVRNTKFTDLLSTRYICGIGQEKSKTYMWPGCLLFDIEKIGMVDFSVNHELGLDTGGNTYKSIEAISSDRVLFFDEVYKENPEFSSPPYNFYASIYQGTFMHFINGSNWNKTKDNEERINSLFNILQNKIDESSSTSLSQ